MRGRSISGLVAICAACAACNATVGAGGADAPPDPGDDANAIGIDAPADAEILGAWGAPTPITTAATANLGEDDGTLSYSGLELVFSIVNAADNNRKDLFYASRPDLQAEFGPVTKLAFSAIGTSEETPRFSADDLTLFFAKTNGVNGLDIQSVTRATTGTAAFGTPQLVTEVNSAKTDKWFSPCGGGHYLMIVGADIAEGTLGNGAPVIVPELSSAQSETGTFVTQDCLTVYFASNRPDALTTQLFTATRTAIGSPWSTPTIVADFAALGGNQQDPFVATNDRTFVFASNAAGTNDLYISTR